MRLHPSGIARDAPAACPVDQEHWRGVMLFSAAYFAAESSISLRMNAGSGAGTQSGHDLELLAVPLHHLEALGTIVIRAGQLERRRHAVDADLLELARR